MEALPGPLFAVAIIGFGFALLVVLPYELFTRFCDPCELPKMTSSSTSLDASFPAVVPFDFDFVIPAFECIFTSTTFLVIRGPPPGRTVGAPCLGRGGVKSTSELLSLLGDSGSDSGSRYISAAAGDVVLVVVVALTWGLRNGGGT